MNPFTNTPLPEADIRKAVEMLADLGPLLTPKDREFVTTALVLGVRPHYNCCSNGYGRYLQSYDYSQGKGPQVALKVWGLWLLLTNFDKHDTRTT